MKNYIIISPEGYTENPFGEPVENLQVIAQVSAENEEHALEVMYEENEWLEDSGFTDFIVKELK